MKRRSGPERDGREDPVILGEECGVLLGQAAHELRLAVEPEGHARRQSPRRAIGNRGVVGGELPDEGLVFLGRFVGVHGVSIVPPIPESRYQLSVSRFDAPSAPLRTPT
jgi:hypothetical protein